MAKYKVPTCVDTFGGSTTLNEIIETDVLYFVYFTVGTIVSVFILSVIKYITF